MSDSASFPFVLAHGRLAVGHLLIFWVYVVPFGEFLVDRIPLGHCPFGYLLPVNGNLTVSN